jgi:hypothetical protein
LCDTLLRLAEAPSLYEPRWSAEIMAETVRTLELRLGWPASLASYFQSELQSHFSEARVTAVVACGAHCGAPSIVTLNVKHFRREHLEPWGVVALHPDLFLGALYREEPAIVVTKLLGQAADRNRSLPELLSILPKAVPRFVELIPADR